MVQEVHDILCLFFVLYVASDRGSEVVYVVQVVPRCFGLKMFNVCFVEMATTQEVELLRRQLGAQCTDGKNPATVCERCYERSSDGTHRRCENDGTVGDETASGRHESQPYVPGKDFDDCDFTFNGNAGTLDPSYPALLNDGGDGNGTTRTAVGDITVSAHDAHTERSAESREKSRFEAYRQLCTMYGTCDH